MVLPTGGPLPHRPIFAVFAALLAMLAQVWLGAGIGPKGPDRLDAAFVDAVCGNGTDHPRPPSHDPSHGPECALCPALLRQASVPPLLPVAAELPLPSVQAWMVPSRREQRLAVLHREHAGQPRAPPLF